MRKLQSILGLMAVAAPLALLGACGDKNNDDVAGSAAGPGAGPGAPAGSTTGPDSAPPAGGGGAVEGSAQ